MQNSWHRKLWTYLWVNRTITINVVICGLWVLLHTFYSAVIRHFRATAMRIAVGIVARIVAPVKSCYSSPYKKVILKGNSVENGCQFNRPCMCMFMDVGRFSFPDPEWTEVSEEAKDLIRGLLVKEAPKRLSAEAVLNHPWIRISEEEPPNSRKMENRRKALLTAGNIRR